jgi:hypothetical protein
MEKLLLHHIRSASSIYSLAESAENISVSAARSIPCKYRIFPEKMHRCERNKEIVYVSFSTFSVLALRIAKPCSAML